MTPAQHLDGAYSISLQSEPGTVGTAGQPHNGSVANPQPSLPLMPPTNSRHKLPDLLDAYPYCL